jgi:protein SCO1/2
MAIPPTQKRITLALWGMVILAMVGIVVGKILLPRHSGPAGAPGEELAAVSPQSRGREALFDAPEIKLTDENDQSFSTSQLRGHPWVADFIFTSCGNVCPIMSARMLEVQQQTPTNVDFVSFTVDPQTDTPAVLKAYGQRLKSDFARWHFLTGSAAQMGDAAYQMKISVKPADASFPIMHSNKFLLINPAAKVVGIYDGTNAEDVKRLIADAKTLAVTEEPPL